MNEKERKLFNKIVKADTSQNELDDIQPNKYIVILKCATYQDINMVRNIVSNAIGVIQEQFVETTGEVMEVIPNPNLQCGYCKEQSIAWIDWKTIGRPKGAPVCQTHLDERNTPDNFGEYPSIKYFI